MSVEEDDDLYAAEITVACLNCKDQYGFPLEMDTNEAEALSIGSNDDPSSVESFSVYVCAKCGARVKFTIGNVKIDPEDMEDDEDEDDG